jgi:predicted dehydrogenase
MFFFAGKPSHVTGLCIREKNNQYTEDTSMGHLFFADGVQGSFLAGGKRKYFHFELELEWERARLYCGNHIRFEIKNPENPFLIQQPFIKLKQENPYLIRLTHLIDLVSGKETVNQSSLEDGLATLKVIDAIYRSSANGGVITAVEENSILPDTLMLKH